MSVLVKVLFWIAVWPFWGKKLSFWLSAFCVLIVVVLLGLVHPSFPLESRMEGVR